MPLFDLKFLFLIYRHPNICDEEISACCLDDRRRKIIIGDIKGKIGVYNCSNGALMKTVHKAYGSTCVALHYYDEAKRFLAGFARGQVCIFDENVLEECILIRQFECYGEMRAEIELKDTFARKTAGREVSVNNNKLPKEMLSIDFDHTTHTVATAGSTDGMLRLWDYTSSKCEMEITVCDVKVSQIVHMKMLLPYSLVVTSDSSGNIVLWGSRGLKWMGVRLSGFLNMTPASAEYEPKARHQDDNDSSPRRALPPKTRTPMNVRRAEETAQILAASDQEDEDFVIYRDIKAPVARTASQAELSALRERSLLMAEKQYLDSEAKWGRCSAAHAMCWIASEMLLITGDDLGHIRCFSLRDAMADLQKEMLLPTGNQDNQAILGLCREIDRDDSSALAPIDHDITSYVLARPGDAMSYLGVRFRWSIYAHTDRIINCTTTPNGVLTSAADRLVKMWDFAGNPLGTLLQSVPIGSRSKTWDLVLDVATIIEKENQELDEIIEQVSELARTGDKPDIYSMDFTGMQLGAESANFSQSVLRQRIELTSKILGIDFPTTGQSKPSGDDAYSVDLSSVAGSVSSGGGKSLADALSEIKSTESGVDYEFKTKSMSYIQQRRKANKLENLSKMYEEKSGVRLNTASKEISIWEDDDNNNNKSVDFDKLLSTAANPGAPRDDASINDDLYSVDNIKERRASAEQRHSAHKSASVSKIAESIQKAHERGPRTMSMLKSCRKYKAFGALDEAIHTEGVVKKVQLTEEEVEEIRAVRQRKIRGASTINSSFLMSAKERKMSAMMAAGIKVAAAAGAHSGSSSNPHSPKAGMRNRHNSADTEGTDDSLRHQFTSLSLVASESAKEVSGKDKMDSPVDHESTRGSAPGSPHTTTASTGRGVIEEY
jgi:WD40 repeat protein